MSNDWENKRFRTVLFNVLLSIGFVREHCRKDRDKYVNVYTSDSQYKIDEDSNELTAFDPFSIMFYGEDKKNMKRVSNNGLFKLK